MSKEQMPPRYYPSKRNARFETSRSAETSEEYNRVSLPKRIGAGVLAIATLVGAGKAVEYKLDHEQMRSPAGMSIEEDTLVADEGARFRLEPDGTDSNYGDAMDKFIVSKETVIESDDIHKHLVGGNEYWFSIPQDDMLQVDGYEINEARNENCIDSASGDAEKANCTLVFVSDQTTDVEKSK